MNRPTTFIACALFLYAAAANADRNHHHQQSVATAISPAYKAECASCHVAYPPAMLSANAWQRVMAQLDRHYGDNASVDDKTQRDILDFLVRNAGANDRHDAPGDPPRITRTPFFLRKHHEVPASLWKGPTVKSAANCMACHPRAEVGSYAEREIRLPGGQRWRD